MTIYIGADHRGFDLKTIIEVWLKGEGYDVVDVGAATLDPSDDSPDFAHAVAEKVSVATVGTDATATDAVRGIVICGSGFGVDIAANKVKGVRSALAMSPDHIHAGRHDDDVNVLALAANFIKPEEALAIVREFLTTKFEAGTVRYVRRIKKMEEPE